MAKQILKEYWYIDSSLSVIRSEHPGRNKEGDPKPPNKKGIVCWTEKGRDCWYFPNDVTHVCSEEDYGRSELMANVAESSGRGQSKQEEKSKGQVNMFSDLDESEHIHSSRKSGMPKLPDVVLAAMERQSLGFCPSGFMSPSERAVANLEFIEDSEIAAYGKDAKYVQIMNSDIGHDPDFPFWRYAIQEEWRDKYKLEWADLVQAENCEPWRAEVRAFLAMVKSMASKDVDIGEITMITIDKIKERFGKKKEDAA